MESSVSPSASVLTIPQGRWLHYGINKHFPGTPPGAFSEAEWNKACDQAARYQVQGVTPKIAQGSLPWYDERGLKMLRDVAHKHGLHIIPMHYVNGDLLGKMFGEVSIASMVGNIFGAYIPDMEGEWAHQGKMMSHFGALIRHGNSADSHYYGPTFAGPIYPTTYGNPGQHSEFPYVEMNVWSNGWIPQVYFNLWTFNGHLSTAEEAEHHVYGQWLDLDKQCVERTNMHLKPVLPLIGLEPNPEWPGNKGPDPREIHNWLVRMQYYGYCGFWSDETYTPYAEVVAQSPLPQLRKSVPSPVITQNSSHGEVSHPPVDPPQPIHPPATAIVSSSLKPIEPPLITVPPMVEASTVKSVPSPFLVHTNEQKETEGAPESQGVLSEGGQAARASVPQPQLSQSQSQPQSQPDIAEQETQLVPVPLITPAQQEGVPLSHGGVFSEISDILKRMQEPDLKEGVGEETLSNIVFSDEELRVLWTWGAVSGLEMKTDDPFFLKWRAMLEDNHHGDYYDHIGYPTHALAQKVVGNVTCTYLMLSSGLYLIQFDAQGSVYVL